MSVTILTGIKPTGSPHLANYIGAIKPALDLAQGATHALYFIANYHALTAIHDPRELDRLIYEVAATWLALGLDPEKVIFYRQSDIPEIFELTWILSCMTAEGLMNRAHAYKAVVARNRERKAQDDAGVNMGLYAYPILMAADILLFRTDLVPVGRDQAQHVETARSVAQHFNQTYGEVLKLPTARMNEETAVIPGLDGRKMSKSYDNTIPIFVSAEQLRKLLMRYKTDSSARTVPKDPTTSSLILMYKEFSTPEETEAMRRCYREGIGWGEVKQALFDVLERFVEEPERSTKI